MNIPDPIRVMTVDDHEIVRSGIKFSLIAFDDLELVGEASSGPEALQIFSEVNPDVVLMDMHMIGMDGIETTRAMLKQSPSVKVIALTSFYDQDRVRGALQAGAISYLVKGVGADDLAESIRDAYIGRATLSTDAIQALTRPVDSQSRLTTHLTKREIEVLTLLAEGSTNKQIAQNLSVSLSTVKYHVHGILTKLGAANRAEAVSLAIQNNIIPKST